MLDRTDPRGSTSIRLSRLFSGKLGTSGKQDR